MKTRLLITFIFISTFFSVKSQNISVIFDPVNIIQKQTLYNLSVLNNTGYSGQIKIEASLFSRQGKLLMKQALNKNIESQKVLSVRGASQAPITVFMEQSFRALVGASTILPPLNYTLCIEIKSLSDKPLSIRECTEIQANDLLQITAIYPQEDAELYESRPVFTWVEAFPNQQATYNFTLVEKKASQSSNLAVRRNIPLIRLNGITGSQLLFPADALPLQNNKEYAWQVSTLLGGEEVGTSDAWSFRYKESENLLNIPRNLSYVDINIVEPGSKLYAVGEFKYRIDSESASKLEVRLFEAKKKKLKEISLQENQVILNPGINMMRLDLKEQVYLKHLAEYRVKFKDTQNNSQYNFTLIYVNPDYLD